MNEKCLQKYDWKSYISLFRDENRNWILSYISINVIGVKFYVSSYNIFQNFNNIGFLLFWNTATIFLINYFIRPNTHCYFSKRKCVLIFKHHRQIQDLRGFANNYLIKKTLILRTVGWRISMSILFDKGSTTNNNR